MKQYEMMELSFEQDPPKESEAAVDLKAVFSCNGESVSVKGFYAGDGQYKVRFLPLQAGNYTYRITGIADGKGTFDVEEAAPGRHGLVQPQGTHLKYSDGTCFHSFGTTVYALAHQTEELMEETIHTLAEAPFNKVRMCVFPKHYQYNHNEPQHYAFRTFAGKNLETAERKDGPLSLPAEALWDVHRPDFSFWDDFEERVRRLGELGIQVDLILFHPYDRWGFSCFPQEENLVYLDYLLRRFSAFPNIWWSMANEYDLCGSKTKEDWYEMEEFISENDPYRHMLSNHNCFPLYDFEREHITHVSIQNRFVGRVNALQGKYKKPVLYDECAYEGNLEETFGSITGEEMVSRFWKVTVTGGYCTHGETYLDFSQECFDDAVVWWAKGGKLIGESPKRIAYLREIVESLPGPIDPVEGGFDRVLNTSSEQAGRMMDRLPEDLRPIVRAISSMDAEEKLYHYVSECEYMGHVGQEVYLFYYGNDRHGRVTLRLPKENRYRLEAVDTWNMTRETIAAGAGGTVQVKIPQRQWMAVIATREDD